MVLSDAVIKLQQDLSEKFGIPTFDLGGGVSTVPVTRPVTDRISVGTGKFTGDTVKSFTNTLNQSIASIKQTGGRIGNTKFAPPKGANPNSNSTNANEPGDNFDFGQTFSEGTAKAGEFLTQNPALLIVGLGLIALKVIK